MSILQLKNPSELLIQGLEDHLFAGVESSVKARAHEIFNGDIIKNFFIEPGIITARIAFPQSELVSVRLEVPEVSESIWSNLYSLSKERMDWLIELYNSRFCVDIIRNDVFNQIAMLPKAELKFYKGEISENPFESEACLALLLKFVRNLPSQPMILFLLRGRSEEQFIHELRSQRREMLISAQTQEMRSKSEPTPGATSMYGEDKSANSIEAFYGNLEIPPCTRQVRADELPAVILKRLDPLPLVLQLEQVDAHLDSAYERIARLAQSLARFL